MNCPVGGNAKHRGFLADMTIVNCAQTLRFESSIGFRRHLKVCCGRFYLFLTLLWVYVSVEGIDHFHELSTDPWIVTYIRWRPPSTLR